MPAKLSSALSNRNSVGGKRGAPKKDWSEWALEIGEEIDVTGDFIDAMCDKDFDVTNDNLAEMLSDSDKEIATVRGSIFSAFKQNVKRGSDLDTVTGLEIVSGDNDEGEFILVIARNK
jgi:hypothetical protein